jgi:hypothetical protein
MVDSRYFQVRHWHCCGLSMVEHMSARDVGSQDQPVDPGEHQDVGSIRSTESMIIRSTVYTILM